MGHPPVWTSLSLITLSSDLHRSYCTQDNSTGKKSQNRTFTDLLKVGLDWGLAGWRLAGEAPGSLRTAPPWTCLR